METSEYSLAVYPPQFRRVTGFYLEEESVEQWGWMDAHALSALHERLLLLINAMSLETPVLCASMCPEGWGSPGPAACGKAICFPQTASAPSFGQTLPDVQTNTCFSNTSI
ncbi:MAG: hypothetical protein HYX67_03920 [Candidatus Melainabacteria bacterium]|nr:hypothetical protein [Candidatus Melainabacteria bacterium]